MDTIKAVLDQIKDAITKRDYDWIHVVTGYEGCGKSTLAIEMCEYIDPEFSIDKIVFSTDELTNAVRGSKPGSAILVDEGALIFFSRDSMTKNSKAAVRLLTGMRTYNLFLCLCVPNYFILDKYLREHRVRSLSKIYERGMVHFYYARQLAKLKIDSKTKKTIWPRQNFTDSFPKYKNEMWKQYIAKKKRLMLDNSHEKDKKKVTKKVLIIEMHKLHPDWNQQDIADMVMCERSTVTHVLHDQVCDKDSFTLSNEDVCNG